MTFLCTGLLFLSPLWLMLVLCIGKYRQSFRQRAWMPRLIRGNGALAETGPGGRIWVHALSVGEVLSAEPLVTALKRRYGAHRLIFTASTRTGFQTARRVIAPHVCEVRYFPYDTPFSVQRAIRVIRPTRVIVVETDIWPVFLGLLGRYRIPVSLVNARLSDRSFRGYRRIGFLVRPLFNTFDRICVQTEKDRRRFRCLGVAQNRIVVTGNIKFDQPPVSVSSAEVSAMRAAFGASPGVPVWVAGSTHAGEEELLADAHHTIIDQGCDLFLIVVPRDPARAGRVVDLFRRRGLDAERLARLEDGAPPGRVVVVDQIGLLRRLYALADITFVGGSLVPAGGHNPLEPASLAKPVLFGPFIDDFHLVYRTLEAAGGGYRVDSTDALASAIDALLNDRQRLERLGRRARAMFCANQGAVTQTLGTIGLSE